jgi:hypothetical protein
MIAAGIGMFAKVGFLVLAGHWDRVVDRLTED